MFYGGDYVFPVLETDRLNLRQIHERDRESIYTLFSNENVLRYYGQSPFENEEQANDLINHFNNIYTNRKGIRWGIELKASEDLMGTVGFHLWSPNHRRAEIGYELLPSYWNNGLGSEAIKRVIQYSFTEMKLHRVGAVVFVENDASNNLLEKLGFEKEGLLKEYMFHNGKYKDTYIYSFLKN